MLTVDIIWTLFSLGALIILVSKRKQVEQIDLLFWIISFASGVIYVFGDIHYKFFHQVNTINATLFGVIVLILIFKIKIKKN